MCWYCGSPVTEPEPIGRSFRCSVCDKDLRSCRNCRFCLSGSKGGCSEANAEPVAEKERANFCDWFKLDPKYRGETAGNKKNMEKADEAKSAFNNLFN
ncbi:MAG: hypothetical protein FWG89_00830 [Treponema sp.]|nr:hypothetical protein [Treponema sp.]